MGENSIYSLAGEISSILQSSIIKSFKICNGKYNCKNCPLHFERMENELHTKCLAVLILYYSTELGRIVDDHEEKGE